jgi:hypothetical protein
MVAAIDKVVVVVLVPPCGGCYSCRRTTTTTSSKCTEASLQSDRVDCCCDKFNTPSLIVARTTQCLFRSPSNSTHEASNFFKLFERRSRPARGGYVTLIYVFLSAVATSCG